MTVAAAVHDSIVELQIANDYKACMAQHWFCTFSSLIQIVIGCHGYCVASEIILLNFVEKIIHVLLLYFVLTKHQNQQQGDTNIIH